MPDVPIVVLGAGAVGKSALTIQFIQGHFVERYDATIEDIYRKPFEIDGSTSVLTIIDTAGQDNFTSMREQYMKKGHGFVLVFSITDSESFQALKKIYAQLRRAKGEGVWIPCVVVGNKSDLSAQRAVSSEEGRMFAAQAKADYLEVSAKDRRQVETVFETLVRNIRSEQRSSAPPPNPFGGPDGKLPAQSSSGNGTRGQSSAGSNNSGSDPSLGSSAGASNPRDSRPQAAPTPAQPAAAPPKKKWKCTML